MSALLSMLARAMSMAVSLACGVVSARLVITEGGVEAYALLSLLVTLPGLLTFSDLGTGAAVVNATAVSDNVRDDEELRRKVRSVTRIMAIFAASLTLVNFVLLVSGGWTLFLGSAAGANSNADLAAFCCVCVFTVTILIGIWHRVLLGLGRNPLVILIQGLVSPIALLIVWLLLRTEIGLLHSFLALGSFVATAIVAILGLTVAIRLSGPLLPDAFRVLTHPRRFPGARVMDVGLPMMAQILTAPLAMTLPRFILAQFGSATAVAQYGVAGQVFFALQALVAATGVALWPIYARQRAQGRVSHGPFLASSLFGVSIAFVTLGIYLIGPWLFSIITDGKVVIEGHLVLVFGLMVVTQALLYPLGMFMMDAEGLRFQVLPSLLMAVSTVILTFVLVNPLEVLAPLVANIFSVAVFQVFPYGTYILRHRNRLYGVT